MNARRLALVLVCACGAAASAQDTTHTITLASGETITATDLERTADTVRFTHPVLGELTVPADGVVEIDGAPLPVDLIAAQPEEPTPEEATAPEWETSLELGLNGSEGNTENLSLYSAFHATREITDVEKFDFLANYKIQTRDGDRTENDLYLRGVQEWYLPESPRWSVFLQADAEYDEFQDWDLRTSATLGIGYKIIDSDDTTLTGRLGLGGAYEFGSPDERLIPEALIGYDFAHTINDRSRITSTGNLYPDLDETGEFRSRVDAAYELDMTDAGDWRLKLGVEHRYDSDSDVTPWDFTYYAALVLSF